MFYQKLERLNQYPNLSPDDINMLRYFLEKVPQHYRNRFTAGYVKNELHWPTEKIHNALDALVKESILSMNFEILCPECSITLKQTQDITHIPAREWCSECEQYVYPTSVDRWILFNYNTEFLTVRTSYYEHGYHMSLNSGDDDINSFFHSAPNFASNKYCKLDRGRFKKLYDLVKKANDNNEKKHAMENLAEYTISTIDGFIPSGRDSRTATGEIDRTFRNDANYHTILASLGPYIQVECKHVAKSVNPSEIGDLTRHIDNINCKTGVYFTVKGITGNTNRDGWLAVLEQWRRHRNIILIFHEGHYQRILNGEDFMKIFFEEYQKVTLQLSKDAVFPAGVRIS